MRRIGNTIKIAFVALAATVCAAIVFLLTLSPVFPRGEYYELYLGENSSGPCVATENPFLDKLRLGGVRGESVRYAGDRADELLSRYHARVLYEEPACGVMNYYCYSPLLGNSVRLMGYYVNLHIAVSETQTAAGTPIIFGGF